MIHGVADSYSETAAYQPPTEQCSRSDSSEIGACRAVAQAENICPALEDCFCGNCACEMLKCEQYPDCQKVRQCALQNNCRGLDCIFACGDIAYGAGEWMTTLALDVADCGTANACPAACPLFP